jgi:class 3 adenylate cyclase/CHASE2 domain-containing sensor protein
VKLSRLLYPSLLLFVGLILGPLAFRGQNFLELWLVDLRFFLIANSQPADSISDHVAVVLMDPSSERTLGVPYGTKWRQFHPALLQRLNAAGTAVIVFDNAFFDTDPERDPPFAAALARAGNVLAGEDGSATTSRLLRDAFSAIGDLRISSLGGKPRMLRWQGATGALSPLSAAAVRLWSQRTGAAVAGASGQALAGDAGPLWIDFRAPPTTFPTFSYAAVLEPAQGRLHDVLTGGQMPLSVFAGRIVLVGREEGDQSRTDRCALPNAAGRLYPGVFGHAYATEMLLRGARVTRTSPLMDAGATLVTLLLLLAILRINARTPRALLLVLLPLAGFAVTLALLAGPGVWLGSAPVLVAFLAALGTHVVRLRISLYASLSRAVGFDSGLIETFRAESARNRGPVRKQVAILIADVRDYTHYVSRTDPGMVSTVMGEYMRAMERCITAEGGYINKYVGDEIVAVFGFPLSSVDVARRAVRAAMSMLEELLIRLADWKQRGVHAIERIGIGVDTGTVSFAEIGGRTRSQFDIIGDCINGASRIEHLTKDLRRGLLVSAEVFRELENDDSLGGIFELVTTIDVRGQGERPIFGIV